RYSEKAFNKAQLDDMTKHLAMISCFALLAFKLVLTVRTNINWDEFHFLSQIHSLIRGDLSGSFQTSYTQIFRWLPAVGQEIEQVRTARTLMVAFLAITTILIWKLATRWVNSTIAWIAPLAYLSSTHVLSHGGSF